MASGFVEHAAIVDGWAAFAIDVVLARYLAPYLKAMSPTQRAEVETAIAAIRAAAGAYDPAGCVDATVELPAARLEAHSRHVDEITVAAAAAVLGVSGSYVRRLAGRWEAVGLARKVGRSWLVNQGAVAAYRARGGRAA
jgi:hypothetical protein